MPVCTLGDERTMSLKDTSKLISYALNQGQKLVEADTEISTIDMSLLSNLNTNQSLNYIKLEQQFNSLEADTKKMLAMKEEFNSLIGDLDHIEKQVDVLADVVEELDQWSKEIEVKLSRR